MDETFQRVSQTRSWTVVLLSLQLAANRAALLEKEGKISEEEHMAKNGTHTH